MDLTVIRATLHLKLTVQVLLLPINLATTKLKFHLRHLAKLNLHPTNLDGSTVVALSATAVAAWRRCGGSVSANHMLFLT
jgi:hypothetical protein